ncbi:50S ribosomal protein L18 [Candidatus Woesearchaeota archaeon]|nr:50S ribosomal protein L18 [Candidatus Woesearchaeota archaeon]
MVRRLKPRTVAYRRKREQRTDYPKRLKSLLSGKLRLVVRFTNQRVIGQLVEFTPVGDKVVSAVDSFALKQQGWKYSCKNIPAAYLTGLLLGKKAKAKGFSEAILDTGLCYPMKKGKIYSFLKGVVDAGVSVPHSGKDIFPDDSRIVGKHIQQYGTVLQKHKDVYQQRFSKYLKDKAEPEQILVHD